MNTRSEIAIKILDILRKNNVIVFEDELDTYIELDSLLFISIVVQIEESFQIIIPDEYMTEMTTVNEFIHVVSNAAN